MYRVDFADVLADWTGSFLDILKPEMLGCKDKI